MLNVVNHYFEPPRTAFGTIFASELAGVEFFITRYQNPNYTPYLKQKYRKWIRFYFFQYLVTIKLDLFFFSVRLFLHINETTIVE